MTPNFLRLLQWLFWQPQPLIDYVESDVLKRKGAWLTLIFLWLPLLIPTIGYFSGHVPLNDTVATIFLVALPVSSWFVFTRTDIIGAALGVLFYLVHVIDKSAVDGHANIALMANTALGLAFLSALIIAAGTEQPLLLIVGFLVLAAGLGTWVGWHVGGKGFISGFLVGLGVSIGWLLVLLSSVVVLDNQFKIGKRSVLNFVLLVISGLAYSVLIWIYWLDGWSRLT